MGTLPGTLHHVGFVVADISAAMPGFLRSMAGTWDGSVFADPYQRVKVAFLFGRPGDAQIELVEPADERSPVSRFLAQRGGGLHHVCYEVDSLEKALEEMRGRGAVIARRPKPATAFQGRRIAWLITPEKLLIELLERQVQSSETQQPEGEQLQ